VVGTCELDEPVCQDDSVPTLHMFTFIYVTIFEKIGLCLPFTTFEKALLSVLNVSLTQLHPNSQTFIQGFHIICSHFDIIPTPSMLLSFFS